MKKNLTIAVIAVSLTCASHAGALALKKNQIYRVSTTLLCGYTNKWVPIKKSGNVYVLKKNATSEEKAECKELLKPSKGLRLDQLPDASAIVKASADALGSSSVSGNPPTFPEIVESGGEALFWRAGVIDAVTSGSPTEDQCNEFLGGTSDGESGGFGACYLTEGVGYSVSEVARSGTSLCYMRKFPAAAKNNSGVVELISGALPGNDITKIFLTPTGNRARTVKVVPTGDGEGGPIFIKVYPADLNVAQGNQYRFDIWFCDDGPNAPPQEFEQTRITAGGEYIATGVHSFGENGTGTSTVRGFLRRSEEGLSFDSSRDRTALFGGQQSGDEESDFKSLVTINGESEVRYKVRQVRGENSSRKGYSVSRFAGTSLADLQFLEGAFKELQDTFSFEGATEYRDTYYAAAPDNAYRAEVAAVDFSSDQFYSEGISIPSRRSAFSCRTSADITISLNMAHEAMQPVGAECEGNRVDGSVTFCQSEALQDARTQWEAVCTGP